MRVRLAHGDRRCTIDVPGQDYDPAILENLVDEAKRAIMSPSVGGTQVEDAVADHPFGFTAPDEDETE